MEWTFIVDYGKTHFSCHKLIIGWSRIAYFWNIVMFLSAVWPLIPTAPIHYRGSIGEQVM